MTTPYEKAEELQKEEEKMRGQNMDQAFFDNSAPDVPRTTGIVINVPIQKETWEGEFDIIKINYVENGGFVKGIVDHCDVYDLDTDHIKSFIRTVVQEAKSEAIEVESAKCHDHCEQARNDERNKIVENDVNMIQKGVQIERERIMKVIEYEIGFHIGALSEAKKQGFESIAFHHDSCVRAITHLEDKLLSTLKSKQ